MQLDPDTSNCDAECGTISEENILYHVACRQQCVLPDFAGLLNDDLFLSLVELTVRLQV